MPISLASPLSRPLVCLDVKVADASPEHDRIQEIIAMKFVSSGHQMQWVQRLDPNDLQHMTIPLRLRGVDRTTFPTFGAIASRLVHFLEGCDICGPDLKRRVLPLLLAEFARLPMPFSLDDSVIVDVSQNELSRFDNRAIQAMSAVLAMLMARNH